MVVMFCSLNFEILDIIWNLGIVIWDLNNVSLNSNRFYLTHSELTLTG